jgi:tetratricopeptide (TPR) repeat protein
MKKEEKERLHEDDRFIKFVSSMWDKVTARRTVALTVVVVVVAVFLGIAVVSGVAEGMRDRALSAADTAETIEEMEKVTAEYPDVVELRLRLGAAYAQRAKDGDLVKAEAEYQAAVNASSDGFERGVALLALGKAKMGLKKYEEAAVALDAAAKVPETQSLVGDTAKWHAGRCYERLGKAEEAAIRYDAIGGVGRTQANDLWKLLADYRQTKMKQNTLD